MQQINMFEMMHQPFKFTKPIRLIELFGGIGSQAKALTNLKCDYTHHKLVEFDKHCINSYNAIHNTKCNTNDITMVSGQDLEIVETKKYDYVMTYSFPCQDLSLAGKQAGMKKGSGTRSGLLWEVERILHELKELPQVLLMENVPDVIGNANIKDFNDWQKSLETLGYNNYVQLLNAKHYGIPQNRNRAFMVSILGDYSYTFPKRQKLTLRLKDFNDWQKSLETLGYSNYVECLNAKHYGIPQNRNRAFMVSILGNYSYTFPKRQKLTLRLKDFLEDEVDEKYYLSEKALNCFTDMADRNGLIRGDRFNPHDVEKSQYAFAITTLAGSRATDNFIKEVIPFGSYYTWKDNQGNINTQCNRAADENGYALTVACAEPGKVLVRDKKDRFIKIPEATEKGYAEAYDGDGVYINRPHQKRGVVQSQMIQTLKTSCNDVGVVIEDSMYFRIRKLTPRETGRLMGLSDDVIDKQLSVVSNSQAYKQHGNGIVVDVFAQIVGMMLERK